MKQGHANRKATEKNAVTSSNSKACFWLLSDLQVKMPRAASKTPRLGKDPPDRWIQKDAKIDAQAEDQPSRSVCLLITLAVAVLKGLEQPSNAVEENRNVHPVVVAILQVIRVSLTFKITAGIVVFGALTGCGIEQVDKPKIVTPPPEASDCCLCGF